MRRWDRAAPGRRRPQMDTSRDSKSETRVVSAFARCSQSRGAAGTAAPVQVAETWSSDSAQRSRSSLRADTGGDSKSETRVVSASMALRWPRLAAGGASHLWARAFRVCNATVCHQVSRRTHIASCGGWGNRPRCGMSPVTMARARSASVNSSSVSRHEARSCSEPSPSIFVCVLTCGVLQAPAGRSALRGHRPAAALKPHHLCRALKAVRALRRHRAAAPLKPMERADEEGFVRVPCPDRRLGGIQQARGRTCTEDDRSSGSGKSCARSRVPAAAGRWLSSSRRWMSPAQRGRSTAISSSSSRRASPSRRMPHAGACSSPTKGPGASLSIRPSCYR